MSKELKIKEAWNNADGLNKNNWANYWNYDKAKEHGMDKDGWIKVCGYEPGEGMVCDYMRPPQLEGIEHNNNWIKIESEKDLPKETTDCFVINHYGIEILRYYVSGDGINCWYNEDRETPITHKWVLDSITHYQPIEKPKPPIY